MAEQIGTRKVQIQTKLQSNESEASLNPTSALMQWHLKSGLWKSNLNYDYVLNGTVLAPNHELKVFQLVQLAGEMTANKKSDASLKKQDVSQCGPNMSKHSDSWIKPFVKKGMENRKASQAENTHILCMVLFVSRTYIHFEFLYTMYCTLRICFFGHAYLSHYAGHVWIFRQDRHLQPPLPLGVTIHDPL